MDTIFHRFNIETNDANKVFEAMTTQKGLAGWWTKHVSAKPEEGSIATFRFTPDYEKHMRVEALSQGKFIKWKCIKGDDEWLDTIITFELFPQEKSVDVEFRHGNWEAPTPLFGLCSYHWALYMKSLKDLVETGQGQPHSMN